jgi:hypothetical protein
MDDAVVNGSNERPVPSLGGLSNAACTREIGGGPQVRAARTIGAVEEDGG